MSGVIKLKRTSNGDYDEKENKMDVAGTGITAFSTAMIGVAAGVSRKISRFAVDTALDRKTRKNNINFVLKYCKSQVFVV